MLLLIGHSLKKILFLFLIGILLHLLYSQLVNILLLIIYLSFNWKGIVYFSFFRESIIFMMGTLKICQTFCWLYAIFMRRSIQRSPWTSTFRYFLWNESNFSRKRAIWFVEMFALYESTCTTILSYYSLGWNGLLINACPTECIYLFMT